MTWGHRLFRRHRMDEQLEKELRFHLDQHTADLVAGGHNPHEARRQARLALGGTEQVKEQCRDARGTRWLEDALQDVRYALRTLGKQRGLAVVALLTLALGVGATTVMFAVVNGVLFKPLPYPEPSRLVTLHEQTDFSTQWGNQWAFAYPNFLDCKRDIRSLAPMAAWRWNRGTVSKPGNAEYVNGVQASAEIFPLLGLTTVSGRALLPDDDRPGATPVVVIGDRLWRQRYSSAKSAIGQPLIFDGKAYTVVGVAPPGLKLLGDEVGLVTPLGQSTEPALQNRGMHPGLNVCARLRPGVKFAEAQSELAIAGRSLARQYPESNARRSFVAEPLRPDVDDVRSTLWLLLGAVGLVLLIACVNVASLLLARAISRERELAMRVALGASRSRLIRQCLTESAVLAIAGGALGVIVAVAGVHPFIAFWPGSLPRAEEVQLDWRVLMFALAASLICGLLFGLAPALRAPARHLEQVLRAGSRTLTGGSRHLHGGFVICELALTLILLVSAAMLGRTLVRLSSLDPGLNIRNVFVARMALSPVILEKPGEIRAAWQSVLDGARHVPGVQSVALVDTVPMREGYNQLGYSTSAALPPSNEQPLALATSVTPEYLAVTGIALRLGRFFDSGDRADSQPVIVIDDVLAQRAFPGQEAVGKSLWIPTMGPGAFRVVGVVTHVRYWGLAADDRAKLRAQLYYPFAQVPDRLLRRWSELMSITVRTAIAPLSVVEPLRRQVRGKANDQVLYDVRTMDELARDSLARQRFLMLLFGIFATLALILASIGIYGVLAYLTSQRAPEIGVRIALGATARDVMRLVLRQSFGMLLFGVGIGTAAALAVARLLEHLVEGMQPAGVSAFAIALALLVLAALAASFIPARRASRIDPIAALRQD